jgi:hypothetical protein
MENVFEELETLREPRINPTLMMVLISFATWLLIVGWMVAEIQTAAGPHPDCQYTGGLC